MLSVASPITTSVNHLPVVLDYYIMWVYRQARQFFEAFAKVETKLNFGATEIEC